MEALSHGHIRHWEHKLLAITVMCFADVVHANSNAPLIVSGAGASFPSEVYKSWILSYSMERQPYKDVQIKYESVGSSTGKGRIAKEEPEVNYAGSDSLLSEEQKMEYPDLKMFPTMAGAVVIGYNVPEVSDTENELVLSIPILAGIYNGSITRWNDSMISRLNPALNLTGETIRVIARSDKSGTTSIFTSGLSLDESWKNNYGIFSKKISWPSDVVHHYGYKNRGMSGLILSFEYSIGYLSISDAVNAEVPFTKLQNPHGIIVSASTQSVQEMMDVASQYFESASELTATLADFHNDNSYPVAGFTYMIVQLTSMKDCSVSLELVRYIDWFTSSKDAAQMCINARMTPLSAKLATSVRTSVLEKITCDGKNMWNLAQADIMEENKEGNTLIVTVMSLIAFIVFCILAALGIAYLVRYLKFMKKLNLNEWRIHIEEVLFYHTAVDDDEECRFVRWPSLTSMTDVNEMEDGMAMMDHVLHWPGKWNGMIIGLRLLQLQHGLDIAMETKRKILSFTDLDHSNVLKFYGITAIEGHIYAVNEYCGRGSLYDIVQNKKIIFNKDIQYSLSVELLTGLAYLHNRSIVHGHLSSMTCMLDTKWAIKIGDWEFSSLYQKIHTKKNPLMLTHPMAENPSSADNATKEYWTAPEIMKAEYMLMPTFESDVYSVAIVIHEIFMTEAPYAEHYDTMEAPEILKAITNNNLRPCENDKTPNSIRSCIETAWSAGAHQRPKSGELLKMVRNCLDIKRSVAEIMMEGSEEYTKNLEAGLKISRRKLKDTKNVLAKVIKHNMPPAFEHIVNEKLINDNSNQSRAERDRSSYMVTKDACVVCVKCWHESNDHNIWTIYNNTDLLISNFLQTYGGNRIDIGTGIFLVVFSEQEPDPALPGPSTKQQRRSSLLSSKAQSDTFSLSSESYLSQWTAHTHTSTSISINIQADTETRANLTHVQAAVEFALSIVDCSSDFFTTDDGHCIGSFLVSIHTGPVHMCLLHNSEIPKCVYVGDTLDVASQLVLLSSVHRVLVSHQVSELLEEEGYDQYEVTAQKVLNGDKSVYYWLKKRQANPASLTIRPRTLPVMV